VERITKESKCRAGASSLEPLALELAVQTPQDLEALRRLAAAGWGRRRIAKEPGCSPETARKYLRQGGWQPYGKPCRNSVLEGQGEWLRQRFLAHRGNADVGRQELEREKKIKVSLRTVERAVEPWRRELCNAALATVRFEKPPGQQLQADFGQCMVWIGDERVRVHLAVLTLGYSRRLLVRAFRSEKQNHWLESLEEGFRHWGGVPQEVLMDKRPGAGEPARSGARDPGVCPAAGGVCPLLGFQASRLPALPDANEREGRAMGGPCQEERHCRAGVRKLGGA
jgi:hypothetical protein